MIGIVLSVVLIATVNVSLLAAVPLAIAAQSTADTTAPDTDGPVPAVSGDWGYPLAGAYSKGRGFGYNPVAGCAFCSTDHKGYDMAQGCGATIYAAGGGRVVTAGAFFGWGNTVRIDHGEGLVSLYGHMQWGSLRVSVGQEVDVGTPLGAEGNTGNSFGCHLHYEVQVDGLPIDPQPFMAARGLPLK
ncbi:M23 family metallopeptidase [Microbacter sp. GSS18]|nr:M23 family metallopeptidase [Microbacter sp. GSS18]